MKEPDEYLNPEAASKMLNNTSPNTMAYWRHRGLGPKYAKFGRRVVYKKSDVEAWASEQFAKAERESA